MKFTKVFRGFSPNEVENYIKQKESANEQVFNAQKQRISQLENQNSILKFELEKLKKESNEITKTLIESQKIAQKISDPQKISELVLARAKIFYAAWTTYSRIMENSLNEAQKIDFENVKCRLENLISAYDGRNIDEQFCALSENLSKKITENSDNLEKKNYAVAHADEKRIDNFCGEEKAQARYFNAYLGNVDAVSDCEYAGSVEKNETNSSQYCQNQFEDNNITEVENKVVQNVVSSSDAKESTNSNLNVENSCVENNFNHVEQTIDLRELIHPTESLEKLCEDLGISKGKDENFELDLDATIGEEDK